MSCSCQTFEVIINRLAQLKKGRFEGKRLRNDQKTEVHQTAGKHERGETQRIF